MKNLFLIFIFFTFLSCSEYKIVEDEVIKYSPYTGEYKIISLISDTNLDLNRDGQATNNFLNELHSYFNLYFAYNQPTLTITKGIDHRSNYITDWIPKQDVNATDDNDIIYGFASPGKEIKYNSDYSKVIAIDLYYQESFYIQQKWAITDEVIILDKVNRRFKIKHRQQYFTIETGWKTCILEAIYEPLN